MPNQSLAALVTTPLEGPKNVNTIVPQTTQDMKCGRYNAVCKVRFNATFRSSLSINAKIIGAGKPNTNFNRLISTVLRRICGKLGTLKSCTKF